jgi:hypothetical protein
MPAMRVCNSCQRRLGHESLLDVQSERMEAARLSVGLEGVRFRYYTCPQCGQDHVFLEVVPLPDESCQDFVGRKAALAQIAQEVRALRTTIVVVESVR